MTPVSSPLLLTFPPALAPTVLPLTLCTAGLCVGLQFGLTALVIARRARTGISLLDGGDTTLARRMRAHGNFTETVPIALLLLALLELAGAGRWPLAAVAVLLVFGRALHAVGVLQSGDGLARRAGMVATLLALSLLGAASLWLGWRGW